MLIRVCLAGIIISFFSSQASAQINWLGDMQVNLTNSNIVATEAVSNEITRDYLRKGGQRSGSVSDKGDVPTPILSHATLNYKPSTARRKQSVSKFVADIRKVSPAAADNMQEQLAQMDVFAVIDPMLKSKGLSVNNYADAQAVLWISIWEASRGILRDTPTSEVQSVRNQFIEIWRYSGEVSALTDAQKQAGAEEAYLNALLIGASLESVKDDPEKLSAYAKDITKQSRAIGIDVSNLTLTANGFVAASRP
jgi:hypothetical protein